MAAKEVKPWLGKLAQIMELKSCKPNRYPKLIFIRTGANKKWLREPVWSLNPDIRKELPQNGWKAHNLNFLQLWSHNDVQDIICEIGNKEDNNIAIVRMWKALHAIYQRAQNSGGLPFHAALVEWNGFGTLLAASSGTGKSTCCHRLPQPWHVLCDDEVLVVHDNQKRYWVHPFPTWSNHLLKRSGRTWNVQNYVPLSAVFFLEKAETDEIISMRQEEAAASIYQSATQVCRRSWNNLSSEDERELKKQSFDNACELAKAIPTFILRVSLHGRFWKGMEKVLLEHGIVHSHSPE